ncbi:MAG: 2OG-Fe(II) oxygenase [Ilumatobacteraceae bacterium]
MTEQYDDLQQIFGYRGAADDAEGVRVIGNEVLVVPFWTPTFCATLIRAAEAVGAFEPQPNDPVPGHEVSLAVISPRLFEQVEVDLGVRIWPQLQVVWPYIDYHGLRDVFVIRYAMGEQEHLRMHHDIAQVSASAKLNEGYEGAVLDFPRQQVTNESAAVGELVVWPSLVTHPHQATPLRSGVKYGLTIWFELPSF